MNGSPQSGPIRISDTLDLPTALEVNILTFGEIVQTGGPVSVGALSVGSVGVGYQSTNPGVDAVGSLGVVGNVLFTISGNAVDTEYPQLSVDGPLDLGAGDPIALVLAGAYVPQPGDVFTIASAGNIVNTFDGLPDGSTVAFNGVDLRIDYTATAVTPTVPPSMSLGASNNLVVSGTGGSDDVTVTVDAGVGRLNLTATVTFAGGQDTVTLALNLPDNTTVGPNTPLTLALTGPTSGATRGGRATAAVRFREIQKSPNTSLLARVPRAIHVPGSTASWMK